MILNLLIGIFVGASVVGSSVQRTISVSKGEVLKSCIHNLANNVFYFMSVYFIANENIAAYVGTAIGSMFIIAYLAVKHRRKNVYKAE